MAPYTTEADASGDGADVEEVVESGSLRLRHKAPKDSVDDDGISGNDVPHPEAGEEDAALVSVERAFQGKAVPTWREQLTVRAFVVSFFLAVWFSIIVLKIYLTIGIAPLFNTSAGAVGFFFVRLWTGAIERAGFLNLPFTRQENTIIQTCVVSAYTIIFSGGFGSYLLGMSEIIAKQDPDTNTPDNVKDPQIGWIMGFLFLVSFVGLFALVPLTKVMIVDYKLTYPSGTASAYLINGFHTPDGAKLAKKQVKTAGKFFSFSVLWGLFQWFYSAGDSCGFSTFPTFGLEACNNRFYFNFSPTFVGTGMICPHIVNVSVLLGGILSWGLMWPLIHNKRGSWFSAELGDGSFRGLQGYRVFISIALILGDGLYNFVRVLYRTTSAFIKMVIKKNSTIPGSDEGSSTATDDAVSFDEQRRTELFLKDQIPKPVAFAGYAAVAVVSIATLPQIFPELKWYYVLLVYVFAPLLTFCDAYGEGLTDWSLASTHGKLAIFIFAAWAGASHGGVLVGLAASGVMMSVVSTAAHLMNDFKTGYLTLTSPKSMFVSQVIGTAMGCVIAPCVFWLFYKYFDIGKHGSEYPAPYATVYRSIAILGVEGFSKLPKNCLTLCYIFFAAAIIINLIRDSVPSKIAKFIPLPMAMAIPFYVGSYFAIDMFVGTVIIFVWSKLNKAKAEAFGPVVASGLICADGSRLPQTILALAKVKPPICMKFLSRAANARVDAFLGNSNATHTDRTYGVELRN